MILLLDHDDSFVHTLADYLRQAGAEATVRRTRGLTLDAVHALRPAGIVLSPGPCSPREAPLSAEVVRQLGPHTPILGVCLGHQVVAAALGATIRRARTPRHGMTSPVRHDGGPLYAGLPQRFAATRYHSLVVEAGTLPPALIPTAWAVDDGELMGVRHREWPVEGVQFHPEAILTEAGFRLVENWVGMVAAAR